VSPRGVAALLMAAMAAFVSSTAYAQSPRDRVEVSGGGVFVGGFDVGDRTAQLTSNGGGTFDQFSTSGRIDSIVGLQARLGVYLTRVFAIEGGVRWTQPVYAVRISGDAEGAPDTTAEETLNQYLFDGSAVLHFGDRTGNRVVPFVYGGAGYLRELHEGDALVEEGTEFHAGGGVKIWMGASRRLGVRMEAGLSVRDGGFDFEEKRRTVPVAGGFVFWVF
jgi:opacity protein-like surface antigen